MIKLNSADIGSTYTQSSEENFKASFYLQAYTSSGINFQLSFTSNSWSERPEEHITTKEFVDFEKEPGKVGHEFLWLNNQSFK